MAMWKLSSPLEIADKASFSSQNVETVQKLKSLLNKLIEDKHVKETRMVMWETRSRVREPCDFNIIKLYLG